MTRIIVVPRLITINFSSTAAKNREESNVSVVNQVNWLSTLALAFCIDQLS